MKKMLVIAAMVVAAVVASAQERKVKEGTINNGEEPIVSILDSDEVTLIEKNFKNFGGIEGWNVTKYSAYFKGEIEGKIVEGECSLNKETYEVGKATHVRLHRQEDGSLIPISVFYVDQNEDK